MEEPSPNQRQVAVNLRGADMFEWNLLDGLKDHASFSHLKTTVARLGDQAVNPVSRVPLFGASGGKRVLI
ncbi:MAG TPA: hypothetical protein VGK00_06825 [Anaerolineales bacterium]